VRRDLDILTQERTIIRTHGGCLAVGRAALETHYRKQVAQNFDLKQAVAARAVEEIQPNQVILLNDGSTTFHLASLLGGRGPLTLYTNSVAMISEISRYDDVELYLIGGTYIDEFSSLRGGLTQQILSMLRFDTVYLGADGIDVEGHCLVATPEEAHLTQVMMRRADRKVLLADHTKVKGHGHNYYCAIDEFDAWITTDGIDRELFEEFQTRTELIVASPIED
jgi:DeoR family fructose operon transcriptional repressor